MAYLNMQEARALTKLPEHLINDPKLSLLNDASSQLIDAHAKKTYAPVPALVKLVAVELIVYLSKDKTFLSETGMDYSYRLNDRALEQILQKLDILVLSEKSEGSRGAVRGGWL